MSHSGHGTVKHTKATQAKTASQLQPRKSSTTTYSTTQSSATHVNPQTKNAFIANMGVLPSSTLYSTGGLLSQERPSTVQASYEGDKFARHATFSDTGVPNSKKNSSQQSQKAVVSRPQTSHNIKGRVLNGSSNQHSQKVTSNKIDFDGSNAS